MMNDTKTHRDTRNMLFFLFLDVFCSCRWKRIVRVIKSGTISNHRQSTNNSWHEVNGQLPDPYWYLDLFIAMGDGAGNICRCCCCHLSSRFAGSIYQQQRQYSVFCVFVCFFLPPDGRSNNFHVLWEYGFLNRKSSRKRYYNDERSSVPLPAQAQTQRGIESNQRTAISQ